MRKVSICFLINKKNGKIILIWLAMKKRGFGNGNWNGAGGKFDRKQGDKKISDTAKRELKQEFGVWSAKIEKVGVVDFIFPKIRKFSGWNQQAHIYFAEEWQGSPEETEEMRPCLFDAGSVPYDKMWDDDIFWLPIILKGKKIRARCVFDKNKKTKEFQIKIVQNLK